MKKLAPFLLLAGCAGGVDQPARVATALVEAVPVVDASGRAAYERELTACPAEPPEAEARSEERV